jgi:hypothetical protein
MLTGEETAQYNQFKERFSKQNRFSRKDQAGDIFNALMNTTGRKRDIAATAATAAGFGDVAKAADTASKIQENGGGRTLDRELRRLNFSSGSVDIVKAIQRLGDRLENAYQNSGDNYITGDYSGIMNRQIESRNNRL